ncbi:GntR family transcriptional regulator [Sphaerobacter thermophilus]|uniref:GntR family transcriptional regulator n=1 Tax=Sphaerobacter thermophilus TaxID=2057 RepID=UPI002352099A
MSDTGDRLRSDLAALRERHARRGGATEIAYWTIRDALRTGILRPGDRLIEVELAAALDMSRTPVREALRRLEAERLVENVPRRGLVVPAITLDDLVDIYEIRGALEGLAARRAAQRMSAAEIEAMRQTVERMERALADDDLEAVSELSRQFHRLLRGGSPDGRLPTLLSLLMDSYGLLGLHEFNAPGRLSAAVAEHRAIYEAVAARDEEQAERLAREHSHNALQAQIFAHHLANDF